MQRSLVGSEMCIRDSPQDVPKSPRLLPMLPQDGQTSPILGHLGAILAPSWRQVCHHFWHPAPVPNRPKSAKTISWRFFFPRLPPRPPRPLPDLDFHVFWDHFWTCVCQFSFWKDSVSNFAASRKFPLGSSSEAGGGGSRPQGVFDINLCMADRKKN